MFLFCVVPMSSPVDSIVAVTVFSPTVAVVSVILIFPSDSVFCVIHVPSGNVIITFCSGITAPVSSVTVISSSRFDSV